MAGRDVPSSSFAPTGFGRDVRIGIAVQESRAEEDRGTTAAGTNSRHSRGCFPSLGISSSTCPPKFYEHEARSGQANARILPQQNGRSFSEWTSAPLPSNRTVRHEKGDSGVDDSSGNSRAHRFHAVGSE